MILISGMPKIVFFSINFTSRQLGKIKSKFKIINFENILTFIYFQVVENIICHTLIVLQL